ncbi:hypothetical protein V6N12_000731 [Hibiscus sabdariffa]
MQQSVPKASGSGLTELQDEEEWAAKEVHLTDDKHKVPEQPKFPNCVSLITLYLHDNYELTAIPPLFFQRIQVLDLSPTYIKSLPNSLPKLVALKKLLLQDQRWDDSVEAVVKEVCNSKTLTALSLYLPEFQLLDSTSLIYPSLSRFRFTVGRHKRRIISRVPNEVEAEFRNWDKCFKFVNGENIPIEIKGVLKYSTSFFLDHHATAVTLSEFGIENMNQQKFFLLAECNEMETLIDGEMHYERNGDVQSNSDPGSVEPVLESLEYLRIYYMENVTPEI